MAGWQNITHLKVTCRTEWHKHLAETSSEAGCWGTQMEEMLLARADSYGIASCTYYSAMRAYSVRKGPKLCWWPEAESPLPDRPAAPASAGMDGSCLPVDGWRSAAGRPFCSAFFFAWGKRRRSLWRVSTSLLMNAGDRCWGSQAHLEIQDGQPIKVSQAEAAHCTTRSHGSFISDKHTCPIAGELQQTPALIIFYTWL